MALDREIPAFAGMGRGVCWFFSGVCGLFVVAFLFFRFRFFHTSIFLALPFFLTLPISPSPPLPPTPPFPRKRESPCDARQRRGIRAVGAGIGRFPLSREWKSGGEWKGAGMERGGEWKRGGSGKGAGMEKGDGNGQGSGNGKGEREGRFSPKTGQKTKKTWCGFKCDLTHFCTEFEQNPPF